MVFLDGNIGHTLILLAEELHREMNAFQVPPFDF